MNVHGEITGILSSGGTLEGAVSSSHSVRGHLTGSIELSAMLSQRQTLSCVLNATPNITGVMSIPVAVLPPIYQGEYSVTPTTEAQTLDTDHFYMIDNITINPIPNNYGLITYDGSIITVS